MLKKDVVAAIGELSADCSIGELKKCSNAGTGCGGCEALVGKILTQEKAKAGLDTKKVLCEHFTHSRQELVHIIRTEKHNSFAQVGLKEPLSAMAATTSRDPSCGTLS